MKQHCYIFKKFIVLLLAIVSLSLLVACGNNEDEHEHTFHPNGQATIHIIGILLIVNIKVKLPKKQNIHGIKERKVKLQQKQSMAL